MRLLIKNIRELVQVGMTPERVVSGRRMKHIESISDAWLLIEDGIINDFGIMTDLQPFESAIPDDRKMNRDTQCIDATGKFVFPSFCDPHTHLVFAGSREKEFADKISGMSYEEIARRGGGILNSARKLHETSEDELFRQSMARVNEIISLGTGAVEIKSGYGLNTADELKMLRVIARIRKSSPLEVRSTFLGAHALPEEFKNDREGYINLVINEMIPLVVSEDLADYIDVFCDRGFFTENETERILMAGIKYGLIPRLHANQLDFSGGVQLAVKYNALSADHLEHTGEEEINALLSSETMPVLLPASSFFLGMPDPPVRKMIDSGLPVALASDYNPGSSPSGNMKLVISLACIRLKMTPAEALNAATINSARAMGLEETHGTIAKGKTGNVFITSEMPSLDYFPYAFGSNLIDKIVLKGKLIDEAALVAK